MSVIDNFKALPNQTRTLLSVGLILALTLALPLFIWGILTQRFDIRKRAATIEPPIQNNVKWSTQYASFEAENFYIYANGKTYYANGARDISVHSDPGNSKYTTLEVRWFELGDEMRLNIYFASDGNKWWASEVRTYNGKAPADWIYYIGTFFESLAGTPFSGSGPGGFVQMDKVTGQKIAEIYYDKVKVSTVLGSATAGECEVCEGISGRYCGPGLTCLKTGKDPKVKIQPDLGGICIKTDGTSKCPIPKATATPTPTPTPCTIMPSCLYDKVNPCEIPPLPPGKEYCPQTQTFKFRVKLSGVAQDSATGAKISVRFVKPSVLDLQTSPFALAYVGNGVYEATITFSQGNYILPAGGGYTIFIKGEKHLARKFCQNSGQASVCKGNGNITILPTSTVQTFDFSGLPLEPGDLPQQDGIANSEDFSKVTALLTKLCSVQTEEEKMSADVDYSGCVNTRDAILIRKTLETKYDED